MKVRTAAAGLGSVSVAAALERDLLAIDNFDGQVWQEDDEAGHVISSALYQIRQRLPSMPDEFIERLLRSTRYNIASHGIGVLTNRGDEAALTHLIEFYRSATDWVLCDLVANKIELLAARLQIVMHKDGLSYRIS